MREPQTIVLLGGGSDIGRAIIDALVSPATQSIVLAARRPTDLDVGGFPDGVTVDAVRFDAAETTEHQPLMDELAARHGDLDVVIVAFAQLGDQSALEADPHAAAELVHVNVAGAVSACLAAANQFRRQGHGRLVVLSSVAGERVRKANYIYGGSKAGLDGFAQGLGDALAPHGASVLIVRPGFVRSKMTTGVNAKPMATTPEAVAAATVKALRTGKRIVWVPGWFRWAFAALRHLPHPLWRRLPL